MAVPLLLSVFTGLEGANRVDSHLVRALAGVLLLVEGAGEGLVLHDLVETVDAVVVFVQACDLFLQKSGFSVHLVDLRLQVVILSANLSVFLFKFLNVSL